MIRNAIINLIILINNININFKTKYSTYKWDDINYKNPSQDI